MNNQIPVTIGFDTAKPPLGYIELSDEVKKTYEMMLAEDTIYVLAPGFARHYNANGELLRVELTELSIIPFKRAKKK